MRSGNRWLIAGLAGITLALPSVPCAAQNNAGRAAPGGAATRPNSLGEATQQGPRAGTGTGTGTGAAAGTAQQGSFQPPAPIRPGQTISVLAFPFGFSDESNTAAKPPAPGSAVAGVPDATATGLSADQQRMSEYLTGIVKAGFLATPAYTVMTYHPQSSLVARALKDNILTGAQNLDVVSPATGAVDLEKARILTNRLGIQAFLVGTMDVKTTPKTNTVEITLDTQLINSATGEVLRSAAVSGAAAGAEGVALQTVQERAALETAQKVLPAMGIQLQAPRPAEAPAPAKGKTRGSKTKASAPKREKTAPAKSASSKDERKAAEETRKQEERQAEAARKEQRKAAEQAREAEKEAKKAAEKAEREAKRQAEKSREQEKRASSSSKKESVKPAVQTDNTALAPHPSTIPAAQTAQAAPAAPAPAPSATAGATAAASAVPNSVTARADASGYPVPYGYAVDATNPKLPARDRGHLKVPAWLGVAGFLTGISFLL